MSQIQKWMPVKVIKLREENKMHVIRPNSSPFPTNSYDFAAHICRWAMLKYRPKKKTAEKMDT